jgi:hypothetical protein
MNLMRYSEVTGERGYREITFPPIGPTQDCPSSTKLR